MEYSAGERSVLKGRYHVENPKARSTMYEFERTRWRFRTDLEWRLRTALARGGGGGRK